MGYVLKAETEKETVYYMNIICVTSQIDCAEVFKTKEDAEKEISYFEKMFHYENPKIEVIEV